MNRETSRGSVSCISPKLAGVSFYGNFAIKIISGVGDFFVLIRSMNNVFFSNRVISPEADKTRGGRIVEKEQFPI